MSINRGTDNKNVAYITMGFYSAVKKNENFRKMDRSRQYKQGDPNSKNINKQTHILFLKPIL